MAAGAVRVDILEVAAGLLARCSNMCFNTEMEDIVYKKAASSPTS